MKLTQVFLVLILAGLAQTRVQAQPKFPVDTAQFAQRTSDATEISLNKTLLKLAAKFLSSGEEDQEARRIIANLDGIYVRSYSFEAPAGYSAAEVEALRQEVQTAGWLRMLSNRSKGQDGDTDVYAQSSNGQVTALFAICAGPGELTFIYIVGPIRPEDLSDLSGNFGIPKVHGGTSHATDRVRPGGSK